MTLLKQLDMAAAEIDLVVLATSEMPDYLHWDTSAGLARELGIERTQTLLLNEGCASGVTGLGIVAGHLAMQPELHTVLFVAVNRVSEYHRNRMNVNNAVHSDGAVAVVLRRGQDKLRWLSTDQFTYPDLCDFFRTDYGGAITPVAPEGWSTATAPSGLERVLAHFDKDPNRLRVFQQQLSDRVTEVIRRACQRAGISTDRLTHVVYINDSADTIAEAAEPFGISIEHTNAEISARHGHMGAADQLISLGELLQSRRAEVRRRGGAVRHLDRNALVLHPDRGLMSLDDGPLAGPELEQAVRAAVAEQRSPEPAVRRRLAGLSDPAAARKLGRLLAGLTPSDDELRPVRVAVLATCTVGPVRVPGPDRAGRRRAAAAAHAGRLRQLRDHAGHRRPRRAGPAAAADGRVLLPARGLQRRRCRPAGRLHRRPVRAAAGAADRPAGPQLGHRGAAHGADAGRAADRVRQLAGPGGAGRELVPAERRPAGAGRASSAAWW